jgi:ribosomal protein S18 acetylase RimI-like enzyme
MNHAMIVREAAPADYEAMSALFEEVDALHTEARPDVFCDPPTPGRSVAFFDSKREAQGAAVFVAQLDGLVVGCAIARLNLIPDIPILRAGRLAYLEELVVAPQCRRRGVGEALMRRVEDWARNQQVARLELTVWEFNRGAIEFYQTLGYATNHRRMGRNLSAGVTAGIGNASGCPRRAT